MVRSIAGEGEVGGGGDLLGVGGHFCQIEECTASDGRFGPQVQVDVLCLDSTEKSQLNKKRSFFLKYIGKDAHQLWAMAVAAGVKTPEEFTHFQKHGGETDIDEQQMVGRFVCLELRDEPYDFEVEENGKKERKTGSKISYTGKSGKRLWAPDDPAAAHIPKPAAAMNAYLAWKGKMLAAAGQAGNGNAAIQRQAVPQAAPQSAPQPAGAGAAAGASPGGDEWGAF